MTPRLGTSHSSGRPLTRGGKAPPPLNDGAAAVAAYFGLIRSAGQGQRSWWAALAPSVPLSAAGTLWHSKLSAYDTTVDITLHVDRKHTGQRVTAHCLYLLSPQDDTT